MDDVYRGIEAYRRKLLSIVWTNAELRREAWETEDELYKTEEEMLKFPDGEVTGETQVALG